MSMPLSNDISACNERGVRGVYVCETAKDQNENRAEVNSKARIVRGSFREVRKVGCVRVVVNGEEDSRVLSWGQRC